ncbi:MAG: DNA polymerase III subunit delta' [bacterium]|nr:DNA polymerase III subunit delta' [bacterium]
MAVDHDKPNPDQLDGAPHPRQSTILFGHEAADIGFQQAMHAGKLHHAWLIQGKEGIGKATLAYRFAQMVLAREDQTNSEIVPGRKLDFSTTGAQLICSDAHPNLLVLRRSWNSKTKKFRTRIVVDDVRELQRFLGNTSGMGKWRVVIIDRADDLNMNAANALLKMLEEPPAFCLFLLVSAEQGKLPTTIISRCQKLRLQSLDASTLRACTSHVADQSQITLPHGDQLSIIFELANGSVRAALEFASGRTLDDYNEIKHILDLLPGIDPQAISALADRLSTRTAEQDYHNFLHLLSTQVSNRIRQIVLAGGGNKHELAQWTQLWETITSRKTEIDLLNLDRGNFILDLFANIEKTAHLNGGLQVATAKQG